MFSDLTVESATDDTFISGCEIHCKLIAIFLSFSSTPPTGI